jgi:hypothetical protein
MTSQPLTGAEGASISERIAALTDEKTALEYDLAAIAAQLDNARAVRIATGQYADAQWFASALAAKRYKGAQHQRLTQELAALRREERITRSNAYEVRFIDAAHRLLAPETVAMLHDEAMGDNET